MLQTLSPPRILQTLYAMRYPNGLFSAARWDTETGYHRTWIRDNLYVALCLERIDPAFAIRTYHALLDLILKHEWKLDAAIKRKPDMPYYYLHPRYDPDMAEVEGDWGKEVFGGRTVLGVVGGGIQ